tara:strand:- start:682 stop:1038 length:357 start_codon:yes stop_codon:yes gene_type:complete
VNKSDFFAAVAPQQTDIDVAGFGLVRLIQLSDLDRFKKYELWLRPDEKIDTERMDRATYKLVTLCAHFVNEDGSTGSLLFDDDDIDNLANSATGPITELCNAAVRLNSNGQLEKKSDA